MSLNTQKAICDGCGKEIDHDVAHYVAHAVKVFPPALIEKERAAHEQALREHQAKYDEYVEKEGPLDMNDPRVVRSLPKPPKPTFHAEDNTPIVLHYHDECFQNLHNEQE